MSTKENISKLSLLPIEAEIVRQFIPYAPDALERLDSDKDWTTEMKHMLANIGVGFGYSVCAASLDQAKIENYDEEGDITLFGEWLYDMVWYVEDQDEDLLETILVAESEWAESRHAIWYDFQKLLVARAKHKLFIFTCSGANRESYLAQLKRSVDKFFPRGLGERYLFMCYDWDARDFYFDQKVVT